MKFRSRLVALGLCLSMIVSPMSAMANPLEESAEVPGMVSEVAEESEDKAAEEMEAVSEEALEESAEKPSAAETGAETGAAANEAPEAQGAENGFTGIEASETNAAGSEGAESEAAETEEAAETAGETEVIPVQPEEITEAAQEAEAVAAMDQNTEYAKAFVDRLYTECLGRAADEAGLKYWVQKLTGQTASGAEVAYGFIFSDEYQKKETSDRSYLEMLYRVLLGRAADEAGLASWLDKMEDGMTRKGAFAGFVNSGEFSRICAKYNVVRGEYQSDDILDKNLGVTAFVSRLYREVLGRKADNAGLTDWVTRLSDGSIEGAKCASGFFFSNEYLKKKRTDEQYVTTLYRVFFDRKPDSAGKADWMDALAIGMSRQYVLYGFAGSQEFLKLCQSYGINAGPEAVKSEENRDQSRKITELVFRYFTAALNRKPSAEDLNEWTGKLINRTSSGMGLAMVIFCSDEYAKRGRSNAEFVDDVYVAMLNRHADKAGLDSWSKKLQEGLSRDAMIASLTDTEEFKNICSKANILRISNGWMYDTYYYKDNERLTGWQTINGQRYYLDPANAGAKQTQWAYVDGYKFYFGDNGVLVTDVDSIIGHQSSYRIRVNKSCNTVTVYAQDGDKGYIIPVKAFVCSTGEATPVGTFYTPEKYRWHELMGPCWGQWCTRIVNGVLFHSVYYNSNCNNMALSVSAYNKLGTTCSHGCVRLAAGDAKWIYDNCSLGTAVTVYYDSTPGPFGKPSPIRIPSWHSWDPTDPTAQYKCDANGCH